MYVRVCLRGERAWEEEGGGGDDKNRVCLHYAAMIAITSNAYF